jgi:DNA-binding protein H-NS
MPKVVEVPGMGNVEFPDSMSDSQISAVLQKQVKSKQPDIFERAVNYHTGNSLIDAPLGIVQGFAKGGASTGAGIGALARKAAGLPPLPADTFKADTEASDNWQGVGKFVEQAAEFAVPGGAVSKATKGSGFLARAIPQAAVGAGVGALQSGGDLLASGLAGGLGFAGEAAPAAFGAAKQLLGNKALNTRNLVMPFAKATPTQQAVITEALPTLEKLGVKPTADAHEMQDLLAQKIKELGSKYEQMKQAGLGQAAVDAKDVLQKLQAHQDSLKKGSVILSGNRDAYKAVGEQIQDVKDLLAENGGKLTFDDLRDLRDSVRPKENWNNSDNALYRKIGNVYRAGMDDAVPGSRELNRDYRRVEDLKEIVDLNITRGKANPSGADKLLSRLASHGAGVAVGAQLGHAIAGPYGGAAGGILGGVMSPKLVKTTAQMLQNAMDSGAFQTLTPLKQKVVLAAAKMGDNATVLKMLGQGATQAEVSSQ